MLNASRPAYLSQRVDLPRYELMDMFPGRTTGGLLVVLVVAAIAGRIFVDDLTSQTVAPASERQLIVEP